MTRREGGIACTIFVVLSEKWNFRNFIKTFLDLLLNHDHHLCVNKKKGNDEK